MKSGVYRLQHQNNDLKVAKKVCRAERGCRVGKDSLWFITMMTPFTLNIVIQPLINFKLIN